MKRSARAGLGWAAAVVLSGLAGCTTAPVVTPGAAAPAAASASAAAAALPSSPFAGAALPASAAASAPAARAGVPTPGQPPAFDTVVKGATRLAGSFTLWKNKEGKVWIELAEADFGAPLYLSPKLATGIGEAGLYGGLMSNSRAEIGRPQLVEFRRVYQQVQLIGRNTRFIAPPGSPEARAVQAAFSASLIGSAALASQPHPQRKTVLVELNALMLGDWLGLGSQLQRAFRQNYSFDARNSALLNVRSKADAAVFEVMGHYFTPALATLPPSAPPGTPPGAPLPRTPNYLPDARSLFLSVHYSLSRLPGEPMAPRAADARIGHFNTAVSDFGDDLARSPKRRHIYRWRLEKQDPAAALSAPVKPITYWIDRDVPLKYRATIQAGILAWNAAFEAIGFKDAIVVKQQPDDADFDTLDMGVASVRWMSNAEPGFGAIGPSQIDPRSGEILDADIALESLSSRSVRTLRSQVLPQGAVSAEWLGLLQASDALRETGVPARHDLQACDYLEVAGEQLSYALDVLDARGELDPASPEAEQFVQAYLKDVTMHEVGHTLGLRHNFRASKVYGRAQLADPQFSREHALTGSVMEYAPINLPRPGEPVPAPFQTTLGPYDYWAIEYAYKPLAGDAQAQRSALSAIAARSAEPALAFGTDEDNLLGLDPDSLTFDLGEDPIAFASQRADIARDLIKRLSTRWLDPGQDYAVLRRALSYALRDVGRAAGVVARQIAGIRTLRDFPNTGRDPLQPVPAPQQRAALDWLADNVLAARGLSVPAALQRRLAPDFLERGDAVMDGGSAGDTDFVPQHMVLDMQRALLAQLMSEGVAQRLLDSAPKAAPGEVSALRLGELVQRIDAEVWRELPGQDAERRALQREHVTRIAQGLLRPAGTGRAEARTLWRQQAQGLLKRLQAGQGRVKNAEQRAHLQDCAEILREALEAKLVREAV